MEQRQQKLLKLIIIAVLLLFAQLNWSAEVFGKSENSAPNPRLIIILVDMSASADQAPKK